MKAFERAGSVFLCFFYFQNKGAAFAYDFNGAGKKLRPERKDHDEEKNHCTAAYRDVCEFFVFSAGTR